MHGPPRTPTDPHGKLRERIRDEWDMKGSSYVDPRSYCLNVAKVSATLFLVLQETMDIVQRTPNWYLWGFLMQLCEFGEYIFNWWKNVQQPISTILAITGKIINIETLSPTTSAFVRLIILARLLKWLTMWEWEAWKTLNNSAKKWFCRRENGLQPKRWLKKGRLNPEVKLNAGTEVHSPKHSRSVAVFDLPAAQQVRKSYLLGTKCGKAVLILV